MYDICSAKFSGVFYLHPYPLAMTCLIYSLFLSNNTSPLTLPFLFTCDTPISVLTAAYTIVPTVLQEEKCHWQLWGVTYSESDGHKSCWMTFGLSTVRKTDLWNIRGTCQGMTKFCKLGFVSPTNLLMAVL